jgi:bifunctional N-acetylglucosamine-1-phosphate-uridyltransferase/glucosamine-1-phosphate-acetyltransferase GlmU-like protein
MNVLILAAGKSTRSGEGSTYPMCLSEVAGTTLIELILRSAAELLPNRIVVALRDEEIVQFHLDHAVQLLAPAAEVVRIKGDTAGAACTALLASQHFNPQEELLIVSANEWVSLPYIEALKTFRSQKLDAGTLIFNSIHPRYSYVRLEEGLVVEAAEKTPISRNATAGFYWYGRAQDFVDGAKELIRKDAHVNGAFYVCPVFNELILGQKRVGVRALELAQYHPVKNERQATREELLSGDVL